MCVSRTWEGLVRGSPIPRGRGPRVGRKDEGFRPSLFTLGHLVSPAYVSAGRWVCSAIRGGAAPLGSPHVSFPRGCCVRGWRAGSRRVAPRLCPRHRHSDCRHMARHPGGPRSFPAVRTPWWFPQGNAWHVFNYSSVFPSVSLCSLIVLSFPKSIYLKFRDQSLKKQNKAGY